MRELTMKELGIRHFRFFKFKTKMLLFAVSQFWKNGKIHLVNNREIQKTSRNVKLNVPTLKQTKKLISILNPF